MQAQGLLVLIALLFVQLGSAVVIPDRAGEYNNYQQLKQSLTSSGQHDHLKRHGKRGIATVLVTETDVVTVTNSDAVVIVNQRNEVVRTDWRPHHGPSVMTTVNVVASSSVSIAASVNSVSSSITVVSSSDFRAAGTSTPVSSSTISVAPTSIPSTSVAVATPSSVSTIKNVANSGHSTNDLVGFSLDYDVITGPPGGATTCRDFNADFNFFKNQNVGLVRTYGASCMTGVVNAAAAHGVRLMVGTLEITDDINTIIAAVRASSSGWGPIDTVYIGNEVVNRGGSASAVAGAVSAARGTLVAAGFNGPVITVDVFSSFNNPVLCSTSTYCGMNAHAFFSAVSADQAGTFLRNAYNQVVSANNGKHTVITETGWPYQGSPNGAAIPSPANQRTAMDAIMREFSGTSGDVYMFQAFNAEYKQPGAFGVEPYFGLFEPGSGGF